MRHHRGWARPARLHAWLLLLLMAAACHPPLDSARVPSRAPTLLAPAADASVDTAFPAFAWTSVEGATYYLIVITEDSEAPDRQIVSEAVNPARYIPTRPLAEGVSYTWQVTAGNAVGAGPASATGHFVVATVGRSGPPILISESDLNLANGAVVPGDYVFVNWRPRAPLIGNEYYDLEFAFADGGVLARRDVRRYEVFPRYGFALHLSDSMSTDDYYLGVECGAAYQWRVRVLAGVGATSTPATFRYQDRLTARANDRRFEVSAGSGWSETWTFTVAPALSLAPTLLAPANGTRISGGALRWAPVAGAAVYEYELLNSPTDLTGQRRSTRATVASEFLIGLTPGHETSGYDLTPGQTYYWHVRATHTPGLCYGPWSELRSFVWTGPLSRDVPGLLPPASIEPYCEGGPCPTETPGPSPTPSPLPTRTPRPSATGQLGLTVAPGVLLTPQRTLAVPTRTAVPIATPTPLPVPSGTPTLVPSATLTPPPPTATVTASPLPPDTAPPGITKVIPSDSVVYYSSGCGPNALTVSALVSDPSGVGTVTLQYRFRAGSGSPVGKWRTVAMSAIGGDGYAAILGLGAGEAYADLAGVNGFVDYLVVARDIIGNEGSTTEAAVSLLYCPG